MTTPLFDLNDLAAVGVIVARAMGPTPQLCWPLCDAVGAEVWVKHEPHPDRRVQGPRRSGASRPPHTAEAMRVMLRATDNLTEPAGALALAGPAPSLIRGVHLGHSDPDLHQPPPRKPSTGDSAQQRSRRG